jgi:hypothetical protein
MSGDAEVKFLIVYHRNLQYGLMGSAYKLAAEGALNDGCSMLFNCVP